MTIQSYASYVGYKNFDHLAQRTLWTLGTLTVGSFVGYRFFKNFHFLSHHCFSMVEGVTLQAIFHHDYFNNITDYLKALNSEQEERLQEIGHIVQFVLLSTIPLFVAKKFTSYFVEEMTCFQEFKRGVLYNGTIGMAGLYAYHYLYSS